MSNAMEIPFGLGAVISLMIKHKVGAEAIRAVLSMPEAKAIAREDPARLLAQIYRDFDMSFDGPPTEEEGKYLLAAAGEQFFVSAHDYYFEGTIQSIFRKRNGKVRCVVESDDGVCLIQNLNNVHLLKDKQ